MTPAHTPGGAGGEPARSDQLERRLSAYDAAAVVVSNVIGSGILFMPAIVAGMVGNPSAMLAVWLGGGVLAFAGAMAYAELAALRPKSGGEYVYLREAFGPLAAFLTGWTSFVAGFSGAIAATSVGLAGFVGRFFPAAGDATPWVSLPLGVVTLTLSAQAIVSLTAIFALSLVHILGIGPGRLVQNALALVKVCALLVFVAAGLSIGQGSTAHFTGGAPWVPSGMLLALIPVMFSYSGWNAAAYLAEEVKDPTRNVPRALAMGTIAVVIVYVAMNVVYLYALDVRAMSTVQVRIVDAAAEVLFGPRVADLLTVVSIFIVLGSISANIFAGPRVYYAMARDGLFLAPAARVNPRTHTPAFAIAAQAAWSAVLVLTGTFERLVTYTGFAVVLFAGIAVLALFVLRRREPDAPRPFRALGYPVAPGLFVLASAAMVVNAIWREPLPSLGGLAILAAGIPVYWLFQRRLVAKA
ncbi:Serine/threonine exchanger SteT [Luteitalea pratensis]|uniref:Serine/threonine exchanger SteT n=1 Tax=Luteitalea pratensis TaxID=1855912 RepID=A0A143PWK8_LUTPR|nr:amino acid permease [Luteitalea pratensis]AMY12204.1 Serine/threonine exchanger SteT [Luteitalea pratensis]